MLMLYNKSQISWKSKLQKTTALSTAEAEYYSASTADMKVLYLRYLLERLDFQVRPAEAHSDLRGQLGMHRVGKKRHRWT
jgi:hypothetical protein